MLGSECDLVGDRASELGSADGPPFAVSIPMPVLLLAPGTTISTLDRTEEMIAMRLSEHWISSSSFMIAFHITHVLFTIVACVLLKAAVRTGSITSKLLLFGRS